MKQLLSEEEINALFDSVTDIKPCGHFVLIQMPPFKTKSAGGIELPSDHVKKNARARDKGVVIRFGKGCYEGLGEYRCPADWGVKEGDVVELAGRYENKIPSLASNNPKFEDLRLVNDSEIIAVGVINDKSK